jgi:hypothetical protein
MIGQYLPNKTKVVLLIGLKFFQHLNVALDAPQKLEFFHSLSITSIFGPMHEVVNVGKK